MAQMPIEIVSVGKVQTINLEQAISVANSLQGEFAFNMMNPADSQSFRLLAYQKATVKNFLDALETQRRAIRGFHPFVIAIVDTELEGETYGNLFGTHRAEHGLAASTIANVEDVIIPEGRMAAYFLYYFARYTLSFIVPTHRNHEETRNCVFDRKVNKVDIVKSMKERAICEICRNTLLTTETNLTPPQYDALEALFRASGELLEGRLAATDITHDRNHAVGPAPSPTLKILFFAANPKDTDQLRLDAEVRAIDQSIQLAEFRSRFDFEQHWAVRVEELQYFLMRHKPDVVHFSGHGSNSSELILEDQDGNTKSVPTSALTQLFTLLRDNIKCVVLNACYSEQQAAAIAQSIDCVVGMANSISDEAAIAFASSFYRALAFGKDIKTAFELGKNAINLEGLKQEETPRLLAPAIDPTSLVLVRAE